MLVFMVAFRIFNVAGFLNMPKASAVGLIGGADGPTAIYVARQFPIGGVFAVAAIALLLIMAGLVYINARRKGK